MVATTKATKQADLTEMPQQVSHDTRNLYQRIAAAKAKFGPIVKNRTNPHYKSKFADLDTIISAVEQALTDEGVLIVGTCQPMSNEAWVVGIRLVNIDNPDDRTDQTIPSQQFDPQKQGQAITYYRRYILGLVLNLNIEDDDDGNAASGVGTKAKAKAQTSTPLQTPTSNGDW
jgi:hypothetical protein